MQFLRENMLTWTGVFRFETGRGCRGFGLSLLTARLNLDLAVESKFE